MHFTEIGEIVIYEWLKTPALRPDMNIYLDEFVLMPNHFHGIIIIGNNGFNNRMINANDNNNMCRDARHCISGIETPPAGIETPPIVKRDARHCISTENNPNNQFGPQIKNLSSVIRGFKSAVTINARKINPYFAWQPRFHDRIIRDYRSYQKIKNYIIDNPKKWGMDDYWQ